MLWSIQTTKRGKNNGKFKECGKESDSAYGN